MARPMRTRRRPDASPGRVPTWGTRRGRHWTGGHDWRAAIAPGQDAIAHACAQAMAAAIAATAQGERLLTVAALPVITIRTAPGARHA